MNEAIKRFIMLVSAHFPRQKFSGDEAREALWLRSMEEILSDFEPKVLMEAAGAIVRERDPQKHGTMFPKASECVAACMAAKRRLELAAVPLLPKSEKANLWSTERLALANDLMKTAMGRAAAAEGWVSSLYHFARCNQRLPMSNTEIEACKVSAAEFNRTMQELRDAAPHPLTTAVIGLGSELERRQKALAQAVLEEAAP
jgi:hypothetical protein